jgi:glycoside hydrolase-like protein
LRSSPITKAVLLAALLALAVPAAAAAASRRASATYTGYGFEACNAPPLETLQAWQASPYRAIGIYIGGATRSCANAELSPSWTAAALAAGWSLVPTYVGLQAPCIANTSRARFTVANAASQGTAAADDAIADATALALPAGSPLYYDMEAYAVKNAVCTRAVQAFVTAWVAELHARGYVAGVYGSASSTGRDLQALAATGTGPDDVWIANWNGNESAFGDPYVSDALWTSHQRIHQYRGGHKETFGGVTLTIDSDFLDAAVVTPAAAPPHEPVPPPAPTGGTAGSVSTEDGSATASWPASAFPGAADVSLTSTTPGATLPGYGNGGYGVQLAVSDAATLAPLKAFGAPVALTVSPPGGALAPVYSANGTIWKHVPALAGGVLAPGQRAGYLRQEDGSFELQTSVAATFAFVPDRTRPSAPALRTVRLARDALRFAWSPAADGNGPVAGYVVTLTNRPLTTLPSGRRSDVEQTFHRGSASVFRVVAVDAAGNESRPSRPVVVLPAARPAGTPRAIPGWAWRLQAWQRSSRSGPRPPAPKAVPIWFWRWAAWQAFPFRLR